MNISELEALRNRLDEINLKTLELISKRAQIVLEIGKEKQRLNMPHFDPIRESSMLEFLVSKNEGPFDDATIRHLFKQIFRASLELQEEKNKNHLLVTRKRQRKDTIIDIQGTSIGGAHPVMMAGTYVVESYEQMRRTAAVLKRLGIHILRGGAFKSRTSPYSFQGLGREGIEILHQVGQEFGMVTVSEIMDPMELEWTTEHVDILEIAGENMQNFSLLKAVGEYQTPVMLKRGNSATIEELLLSAEYIVSRGNSQVILLESGIRTYEKWTRNTLDISAVPILKKESHLPILVDISHSTGRKDIVLPCAKAALAAGADGILVEVHPDPAISLSNSQLQLNLEQFEQFYQELIGGIRTWSGSS